MPAIAPRSPSPPNIRWTARNALTESPELGAFFAVATLLWTAAATRAGWTRVLGVESFVIIVAAVGGGLWSMLLRRASGPSPAVLRVAEGLGVMALTALAVPFFDDHRFTEELLTMFVFTPAAGLIGWQMRCAPSAAVAARIVAAAAVAVACALFAVIQLLAFEGHDVSGDEPAAMWVLITNAPVFVLGLWGVLGTLPQRPVNAIVARSLGALSAATALFLVTRGCLLNGDGRWDMIIGGLALALGAHALLLPPRTLGGVDRAFAGGASVAWALAAALLASVLVAVEGPLRGPDMVRFVTAFGLALAHGANALNLAFDGRARHDVAFWFLSASFAAALVAVA